MMKKRLIALVVLTFAMKDMQAQKTPTNHTNWISTKTYLQPSGSSYMKDMVYYDGLGYPTQEIAVGASPLGRSVMRPIYYDEMLRDSARVYLPVVTESTAAKMYADPFALSRYQNTYGTTEEGYVYARSDFDNSISNRKVRNVQPGKVFHDSGKETAIEYGVNRGDNVLRFEYVNSSLKAPEYWPDGMLRKTTVRNEDGGEVITFLDGQGNVLLSRSILGTKKLDTYYLYDKLGRLCHVFPPECSADIRVGYYVSGGGYDYEYRYDKRNRVVEKTLPGYVTEEYVYDRCDRVTMSQNGIQRKDRKWTCNEYDALGRMVKTLEVTLPGKNRSDLQAL